MSTSKRWLFAQNLLIFFKKRFVNLGKWGKWPLDLLFSPKIVKIMGIIPIFIFFFQKKKKNQRFAAVKKKSLSVFLWYEVILMCDWIKQDIFWIIYICYYIWWPKTLEHEFKMFYYVSKKNIWIDMYLSAYEEIYTLHRSKLPRETNFFSWNQNFTSSCSLAAYLVKVIGNTFQIFTANSNSKGSLWRLFPSAIKKRG